MRYIDLSHTITDGLVSYRGLPPVHICDYMSREASRVHYDGDTSFHIGRIDMVANTGTYIDCPSHRYATGRDLSEIHLREVVNLEGIRVHAVGHHAIGPEFFESLDLHGKAVLVQTGWSFHWGTETYYHHHPHLTEEAASLLRKKGVALVGIDSHNIDDTDGRRRPVHTILLGADIFIVEHMVHLEELPEDGFLFTAIPPKVKGMGTFPVRAFASVYRE